MKGQQGVHQSRLIAIHRPMKGRRAVIGVLVDVGSGLGGEQREDVSLCAVVRGKD
jgi:hypothetical protein